jgi:hypothetical protein
MAGRGERAGDSDLELSLSVSPNRPPLASQTTTVVEPLQVVMKK